jgi:hypothetical protein
LAQIGVNHAHPNRFWLKSARITLARTVFGSNQHDSRSPEPFLAQISVIRANPNRFWFSSA